MVLGRHCPDGGVDALQESNLADELVESKTIAELESTLKTISAGFVAEDGSRIHEEVVKKLIEHECKLDGSKKRP